jgi:hypothetical protein
MATTGDEERKKDSSSDSDLEDNDISDKNDELEGDAHGDKDENDQTPAWLRYAPRTGWTSLKPSEENQKSTEAHRERFVSKTTQRRKSSNPFSPLEAMQSFKAPPKLEDTIFLSTRTSNGHKNNIGGRVRYTRSRASLAYRSRPYSTEEAAALIDMWNLKKNEC